MNKFSNFIAVLILLLSGISQTFGQLEKVIIERYYVSDDNDATDITGGGIETGTVTYRIYVDMLPGSELLGVYGDAPHPFSISSSEVFYNNLVDGQTYAYLFNKNRFQENTVALDTWLTLGQTAIKQGPYAQYGILKDQDVNGTFIGGVNNDGGSELIASGLLINEDPTCGLPLTIADGMDTSSFTPVNWIDFGLVDFISGNDSTIFGSLVPSSSFVSDNFSLSNSGVRGQIPDSNQVLIAQLTTKGELSFQINLKIKFELDGEPIVMNYVGTNVINSETEVYNPYLNYPYSCGCNDPSFLEYDPSYICFEEGSCMTPLSIGCMDSLACNYDPFANQNVPFLCCYPGQCNERNIEEVCPSLKGDSFDFSLFPNPASGQININIISGVSTSIEYVVYNSYGVAVDQKRIENPPLNFSDQISLSDLHPGIYRMSVKTNLGEQHKLFVVL